MEKPIKGIKYHPTFPQPNPSHERWLTIATLILLSGGFLSLINWFGTVDVYHRHFFENGSLTLTYNFFRILFAFFLIWIIYAVGYGIISLMTPKAIRQEFTLAERLLVGFGTGMGFWHVFLLILGIFNLYYRSVMMGLCLIVLCASVNHFKRTINELGTTIASRVRAMPGDTSLSVIAVTSIIIALFFLLLVRGLYPGGGGDYFTHYFYYYLAVIHSHGLAPNDVWYHYYYSKGAGLHFLGMLLTDPEAPQIVTFCCVAMAVLALTSLSSRVAPRSLWPAFCAIFYILYNLVALNGGGEFQKIHEETTALVVLIMWAICMVSIDPRKWVRPAFITMASIAIGAAILTQAIAVFLGILFGVLACVALIKKNLRQMWFYGWLAVIAAVAVISILLLNYEVTGLATDQAINLTWRFANLERLNQWGVIPNIIMVAWIRDNYDLLVPPWGWESIRQLVSFMRLDMLSILVGSSGVALIFYLIKYQRTQFKAAKQNVQPIQTVAAQGKTILFNVSIAIGTFAILSLVAGRSQAVSYYRFSSFFVPLLILFSVICWGLLISVVQTNIISNWLLRIEVPIILLFAILFSWPHWFVQVRDVTKSSVRFMEGKYSLAQAYKNQHTGFPFGGINPGAFNAMTHIPKGTRVWSTNVDSYCMAPDCTIESVISFKLSSRLNEILNDPPAQAKSKLQSEGLNYFLYSADSSLIDLLPYSRLFNPATLNQYFGVQWTDGKTYLLTWKSAKTLPLNQKFFKAYAASLKEPESSWFMFSKAVPALNDTMQTLMRTPHPWKPIQFTWRQLAIKGIDVKEATYGDSCLHFHTQDPYVNTVQSGNATVIVKQLCDRKMSCHFIVTDKVFGDPATGCAKDFNVAYRCPNHTEMINASINGEAFGKKITLDCRPPKGVEVVAATYGENCWFKPRPWFFYRIHAGNATAALRETCYGKKNCNFLLTKASLGDPAPGCKKNLKVDYYCPLAKEPKEIALQGEALGKQVNLNC